MCGPCNHSGRGKIWCTEQGFCFTFSKRTVIKFRNAKLLLRTLLCVGRMAPQKPSCRYVSISATHGEQDGDHSGSNWARVLLLMAGVWLVLCYSMELVVFILLRHGTEAESSPRSETPFVINREMSPGYAERIAKFKWTGVCLFVEHIYFYYLTNGKQH